MGHQRPACLASALLYCHALLGYEQEPMTRLMPYKGLEMSYFDMEWFNICAGKQRYYLPNSKGKTKKNLMRTTMTGAEERVHGAHMMGNEKNLLVIDVFIGMKTKLLCLIAWSSLLTQVFCSWLDKNTTISTSKEILNQHHCYKHREIGKRWVLILVKTSIFTVSSSQFIMLESSWDKSWDNRNCTWFQGAHIMVMLDTSCIVSKTMVVVLVNQALHVLLLDSNFINTLI